MKTIHAFEIVRILSNLALKREIGGNHHQYETYEEE
jgi:hypothetical protein